MEEFLKNKVAIFTGDSFRHKYFAYSLSEKLNVKLIVFEKKVNLPEILSLDVEESIIVNEHFMLRDESEQKYFAGFDEKISELKNSEIIEIENNTINSDNIINKLKTNGIEYILLFGCSIIKSDIINLFRNKIINLHLGLSPYYRGSGTNFWPLVDNLPECVGATIHITDLKIDAGGILHQVRPDISENDDNNDLGNKTIINAVNAIPDILKKFDKNELNPSIQNLKEGKLFKRKDFNGDSILEMRRNFKNDMIRNYLNNKAERLNKYKIIENL